MKMLTGLICLLLVSSVGCGQQNDTSSQSPVNENAATATPPVSSRSSEPAASTQVAPAPQAAAIEEGESIAAGEAVENVEEKTSADAANTRLASAMTAPSSPPTSRWQKGTHYQEIVPTQPTNAAPDKV